MLEYMAWGTATAVGAFAIFIWWKAFQLHMENDRADGPCGVHRGLHYFFCHILEAKDYQLTQRTYRDEPKLLTVVEDRCGSCYLLIEIYTVEDISRKTPLRN